MTIAAWRRGSGLVGVWVCLASGPLLAAPDDLVLFAATGVAEDGAAEIGQPRPALEVDALDGGLVNDARVKGHALIVDFFATWCEPCHRALADLIAARGASGATGVTIVLVDLGEPRAVVRKWAASAKLPDDVTIAVDPDGIAARRWGARRLPTTYLVDADGVVRHINRGWGPGYRDRLSRWMRAITQPDGRDGRSDGNRAPSTQATQSPRMSELPLPSSP
jgi:thiol-disulfide isomerase/thioredoxin